MIIRRSLSTLAGARWDILSQTPVDHFRYVATGGVLLTTAGVAAVSAAFALTTAVHISLVASVIAGFLWGGVILNLDRLLIIGMTRRSGWWRNILAALPRLGLAILIGMVISTPLVLRIFQPEVEAQMKILQNGRKEAFENQVAKNPRYAEIPDLERKLADKQAEANRSPDAAAADDPSVKAAQQKVDATRQAYEAARDAAQCEVNGTCGTRRPGVARAAEEALNARDVALRDYDDARAALTSTQGLARDAAVQAANSARQEADRIQRDLTERRNAKNIEQSNFDIAAQNDNGLLARLEALSSLGGNRPELAIGKLVLFLLFLSLEVLPVMVKLLQLSGPPTLYEQLVTKMEESAKRASAKATAREENIADDYAQMQAELEHDQASLQYEAGLRANKLLVARQSSIAEQAIVRWSTEAERRSRQELTDWFHQHDQTRPIELDGRTIPLLPVDGQPRAPRTGDPG